MAFIEKKRMGKFNYKLIMNINIVKIFETLFKDLSQDESIELDQINDVAIKYLKPLLNENIESLILGCSHYPLINPLLSKLLPPNVRLIDPADAISLKIKMFYSKTNNFIKPRYVSDSKFYVTSDPVNFADRAKNWLNLFPEVNLVSLQKKAWVS